MLGAVTGLQSYTTHQNIGQRLTQTEVEASAPVSSEIEEPKSSFDKFSLSPQRYSFLSIAEKFNADELPKSQLMEFRTELFSYNLIGFPEANIITLASNSSKDPVNLSDSLNAFFDVSENQKFAPLKSSLMSTVGNLSAAFSELNS
jgi:hypothetical protein